MINKIILGSCLLLSFVSFSQEGTSSPYSFYGIGESRFSGTMENRAMAGLSIAQDSTHINLQNPAGLANLKWTAFTAGASSKYTDQKTNSATGVAKKTTFDYLSLGIPLGRFGAAMGLIPYSSVGYKIQNISTDEKTNSKRFNGWGGLNRVFIGTGFRITSNLNIGANVYYNFGKLQTNGLEFIPNILIGSRELNVATLSGLSFNMGLTHKAKINNKLSLFSSLYYTPESTLVSDNTRSIATVSFDSNFDVQVVDPLEDGVTKRNLTMPQKWSFGAGVGDAKKWLLGGEVSFQEVGKLYNNYNTVDKVVFGKYQKYSIGGYFIPSSKPFVSYAKRIIYRGGFRFEKTGLVINETSIDDMAVTFGAGLPITGSLSNINVGFEIGKKGTKAANLVQENYFNLTLSFSLNDKWFVKSKYR
jgi:hypothetical protein